MTAERSAQEELLAAIDGLSEEQARVVATASGSMFIFRAEGQPVRESSGR